MKKILLGLFLFLAAVVPAGAQQLAFTAVTASATAVGAYSNMPIDTNNYPWAQSIVWTFTAVGNSGNRFQIDAGNDSSFTASTNPLMHFSGGVTGHNDVTAASVPVVGESWCVPVSAGRYLRLRATTMVAATDTAIVILSPSPCIGAAQQGQPNTFANGWPVFVNPYPLSATVTTMAGAGTTGAVTIALAAQSGKITYLCGFDVSAIGGTAAIGPITIGQVAPGFTLTYQSSSSAAGVIISKTFTPCLPAPTTNTQITGTTTADGTATAVNFSAYGYIQ